MKKVLFALAAAMLASAAVAAEGGAKLGVGAAVSFGQTAIVVPINIAPGLRVEPFLGFDRTKETDTTNPAGDFIRTDTNFDLGCGVYLTKEAAQNVEIYGGGRVALRFLSMKDETPTGDTSASFTGFGIAAVGGAEYYFSPRFALGVEAEVGLRTIDVVLSSGADGRTTTIDTASFVTAKVFFK